MLSNTPLPSDAFEPSDASTAPMTTAKAEQEWNHWLRRIASRRRLVDRPILWRHRDAMRKLLTELTCASFRLEGLDVAPEQVREALAAKGRQRSLRARQFRRLRNHMAILQQIEIGLRHNHSLKPVSVIRWYTSISAGLCTAYLPDAPVSRLEDAIRRINCPQLRLQGAIQECGRLHYQLLHDPLVPSFNGILARLLLHYHLGRCRLPPVVFDPESDAVMSMPEPVLTRRLLRMVDQAYERLLPLSPASTH